MADFLVTMRKVKKSGKTKTLSEEPGAAQFLTVPHDQNPDAEHICTKKDWLQAIIENSQNCEPVIFLVHADQRDCSEALNIQRQFKQQIDRLGFKGNIIGFDWVAPVGSVASWEDRDHARECARRLRDDCIAILCQQQMKSCTMPVHILAHGSGAFVLREAMSLADEKQSLKNQTWRVNQIALIGADISSRSLRGDNPKSSAMLRHCHGLTNYQNPYDKQLSQSNAKHQPLSERAGRVGLPHNDCHPKAINVNCGEQYMMTDPDLNKDLSGDTSHNWYLNSSVLLQDFLHCIEGKVDRHYIPTRHRQNGELTLYNPESIILLEE